MGEQLYSMWNDTIKLQKVVISVESFSTNVISLCVVKTAEMNVDRVKFGPN